MPLINYWRTYTAAGTGGNIGYATKDGETYSLVTDQSTLTVDGSDPGVQAIGAMAPGPIASEGNHQVVSAKLTGTIVSVSGSGTLSLVAGEATTLQDSGAEHIVADGLGGNAIGSIAVDSNMSNYDFEMPLTDLQYVAARAVNGTDYMELYLRCSNGVSALLDQSAGLTLHVEFQK